MRHTMVRIGVTELSHNKDASDARCLLTILQHSTAGIRQSGFLKLLMIDVLTA